MPDTHTTKNIAMRRRVRKTVATMPETFLQRHAQAESTIYAKLVLEELRAMEKEGLIERVAQRVPTDPVQWRKTPGYVAPISLMDRLRTVKNAAEWQREYLEVAA